MSHWRDLFQFIWVRVIRKLRDIKGEKHKYSIRVLECDNVPCPTKYHRELPNIIIPYKRFDAESIEDAIERDNSKTTVVADELTIRDWRKWFKTNAKNIIGALKSAASSIDGGEDASPLANEKQDSQKPIETIKKLVGREINWLGETARILVNYSMWPFNRSYFLSG